MYRHGEPRSWCSCLRRRQETGFTTISLLLCMGLTLLVMVWIANVLVFLYGRGAIRAAIDDGARAGSRVDVDSAELCRQRAGTTLGDLLGGSMGREVTVACAEEDGLVRARADAVFRSWLPPLPDWRFQVAGTVIKERFP